MTIEKYKYLNLLLPLLIQFDKKKKKKSLPGLSIGAVPGTFTRFKWSLVPPYIKECCIRYS